MLLRPAQPGTARRAALCIGVLGLVVSGCQPGTAQPTRTPSAGEDLPILWKDSGTYSRLARSIRIVARDPATLAQIPLVEVPVDFDSQMVLIAGLGPLPNNRLGIRIRRVWREGSRIRVLEQHIHPGIDQAFGLRPASPWTVVVVPRSELNVEGYSPRVPEDLLGHSPVQR